MNNVNKIFVVYSPEVQNQVLSTLSTKIIIFNLVYSLVKLQYSRTSGSGHRKIRDTSPIGTFFLGPEFAPLT